MRKAKEEEEKKKKEKEERSKKAAEQEAMDRSAAADLQSARNKSTQNITRHNFGQELLDNFDSAYKPYKQELARKVLPKL